MEMMLAITVVMKLKMKKAIVLGKAKKTLMMMIITDKKID